MPRRALPVSKVRLPPLAFAVYDGHPASPITPAKPPPQHSLGDNVKSSWIAFVGAGALAVLTSVQADAQISTSSWYSVVNKNSRKCVDAAGSATANGTVIQQWTCNGTSAQNWQFQATSGGYYKVVTRNNQAQVW